MANSLDKSSVILFDSKAKTENFKRSNHNDFATSTELRQREFSGWRENTITDTFELWVKGGVVRTVSTLVVAAYPGTLEKMLAEFTGVI